MHASTAAFAVAGLVLWHMGRLDQGPLGMALRGELGTLCIGLAALGLLVYGLLFAADALGLRRRNRQFQSAPRWRQAVTWIVLPVLAAGYSFGLAEQLRDSTAWPGTTAAAAALPTAPVAQYPASIRQHFMNSCITGGQTQSSCACSIDGIQAHYTLKDFVALDTAAQSGQKMPAELVRIVSACNAAAR